MKLIFSQHIYQFKYKGDLCKVIYESTDSGCYTAEVLMSNANGTYTLAKGSYPSRRQAASLVVRTEREWLSEKGGDK